eukprot:TRINITY_DN18450_c0_g4_i1.p1 TRINITY_DN18450_c0_g4~~TRINITY_DN18450_c0_g4_i1.p1  ORF type:complete len:476 (+),score=70.70 TRINITY_DN18450_c0_g4_i1:120-1547(+)
MATLTSRRLCYLKLVLLWASQTGFLDAASTAGKPLVRSAKRGSGSGQSKQQVIGPDGQISEFQKTSDNSENSRPSLEQSHSDTNISVDEIAATVAATAAAGTATTEAVASLTSTLAAVLFSSPVEDASSREDPKRPKTWRKEELLGSEIHRDVLELLSSANEYSPLALKVLQHAAPKDDYQCALDRWDQYAQCYGSYVNAKSVWSFGINGYDDWAERLSEVRPSMVANTFDCFNKNMPDDFRNNFSAVCLGNESTTKDGRRYTTLPLALADTQPASALVKMDIEGSEYDVLEGLTADDFLQIGSLHVEYHFNYGCPTKSHLERAAKVLQHVAQHLVVVDAGAGFYGDPCLVDGKPFPKLLTVSYAHRDNLWPSWWIRPVVSMTPMIRWLAFTASIGFDWYIGLVVGIALEVLILAATAQGFVATVLLFRQKAEEIYGSKLCEEEVIERKVGAASKKWPPKPVPTVPPMTFTPPAD